MLVRAETRLGRGDAAGGRQSLEEAVTADPTLVVAALRLATLYEQTGSFDDAERQYRRVLAVQPANVAALNNLAYVLAVRQKSPAAALPLAEKAHALAPASASVIDTLAWVQHLLGHDGIAQQLLTDAMRRAPKSAEIHWHAAVVAAASERQTEAAAALRAALLLDPSFDTREDVRALKARLIAGGWYK